MTLKQITVTLRESQINELKKIANDKFDGNLSLALRCFLKHNGLGEKSHG